MTPEPAESEHAESCGFGLYGPPAICTCRLADVLTPEPAAVVEHAISHCTHAGPRKRVLCRPCLDKMIARIVEARDELLALSGEEMARQVDRVATYAAAQRQAQKVCPICTVTEYVCPACEQYADKGTVLGIIEEAAESDANLRAHLTASEAAREQARQDIERLWGELRLAGAMDERTRWQRDKAEGQRNLLYAALEEIAAYDVSAGPVGGALIMRQRALDAIAHLTPGAAAPTAG